MIEFENIEQIIQKWKTNPANVKEHEVKFHFRQTEIEAKNILNYLTSPKRTGGEKTVLQTSETINSRHLDKVAETYENLDDILFEIKENKEDLSETNVEFKVEGWDTINYEITFYGDIYSSLKMYSRYLKDRKNPKNLNTEELKNIVPNNGIGKPYRIEKYRFRKEHPIDKATDKIKNKLYSLLIKTVKTIAYGIDITYKAFKGIDNFTEKITKYTRVTPDGTFPKDFYSKKSKN